MLSLHLNLAEGGSALHLSLGGLIWLYGWITGTSVREKVAHRHYLHVGMVLETERSPELADTETDEADAQLAV